MCCVDVDWYINVMDSRLLDVESCGDLTFHCITSNIRGLIKKYCHLSYKIGNNEQNSTTNYTQKPWSICNYDRHLILGILHRYVFIVIWTKHGNINRRTSPTSYVKRRLNNNAVSFTFPQTRPIISALFKNSSINVALTIEFSNYI